MPIPAALTSSAKQDWTTPRAVFDPLHQEFGFTLDAAASAENALCPRFFTQEDDGLAQDWSGEVVWCNPPYDRVAQWVEKAAESAASGVTVVMLIFSRTETKWWHRWIWDGEKHCPRPGVGVRFIRGRLRFSDSKNSAPAPSVVVIFRPQVQVDDP